MTRASAQGGATPASRTLAWCARRGSNVECRLPLYQDEKTKGSEIAVDAMAFGMGCCCLQVTFQCRDVDESRHVYDQLAVLAPARVLRGSATS